MTINGIKTVKIKDIGKIITGKTPPTSQPELFGDKYPFITPSDIRSFDVRYIDIVERGLSDKGFGKQKRGALPKDTVCYVCIGSTIGKVCLTNKISFTNQQINSILVNRDKFNPKYVYYLLRADTPKIQAISGGTGAGKAILNKSSFEEIELNVYPLSIQHKIATILSAYDDLVENNTHHIKILEEMAQMLYQEWFVKFRFPGNEKVKMVESEFGMIPEGWEVSSIGSISEKVFSGGTPTTTKDAYWGGFFSWLSSGETRDKFIVSTEKHITEEGIKNSSTRLAKRFDIVVASAGQGKTRGQTSLLLLDTYINQSVISIRVKDYCKAYAFFNISSRYDELRHISDASSIRGSLTTQIFNSLPILLPDTKVLQQYNDIAMSNILLIENLRKKNAILCHTRDLLLPKLISGELDVEDLDINVGCE